MNDRQFADAVGRLCDHFWQGLRRESQALDDIERAKDGEDNSRFQEAIIMALANVLARMMAGSTPVYVSSFLGRLNGAVVELHARMVAEKLDRDRSNDNDTIGPTAGNA